LKLVKRLRPRRSLKAAAAAALGVLSMAGVTLGFAGTASATNAAGTVTTTPISYGPSANTIGLLPNSNSAGGKAYAITAGGSNQPGWNWTFTLSDSGTVTAGTTSDTWAAGDAIVIPVFDHVGHVNNVQAGDYVEFTPGSTPQVVCSGGAAGATAPTFSVSTINNPNDNAASRGLTDVLVIEFTDNPVPGSTQSFNCAILGVNYTTGPATPTGALSFDSAAGGAAAYVQGSDSTYTDPLIQNGNGHYFSPLTVIPNAVVSNVVTVSANNPPVSVLPNAVNAAISPISLTESVPGTVPTGYICVTASAGGFTLSATTPTLTVSPSNTGGTAAVNGTVQGVGAPNANGSFTTIAGLVTQVSLSVPTTFTFSGLTVDAPGAVGPVTATITVGAAAGCTGGTQVTVPGNPDFSPPEIYAVGQQTTNTRIFGSTADATAVASLEYQYDPEPGFCIPQGVHPSPSRYSVGSSVVLATDTNWPDALTASYLASYLQTGVLLTPTDTLSAVTLQAIRAEGVSNVFIVGGPLAVSNTVQTQLENTPAYLCGGQSPQTTATGAPQMLNVVRIYGQTALDTAQQVAEFVGPGYDGNNLANLSGAFGLYNDTTGTDSGSSPTVPQRTAILVTDQSFQDASSASALSYWEGWPIVLTDPNTLSPQALQTLQDLAIAQVVEIGGPIAISDAVNTALQAAGISVLRIAGQDYSDTSVQLAKFELNQYSNTSGEPEGLGWSTGCSSLTGGPPNTTVSYRTGCTFVAALARGDYFADALTSSVVTGGGGKANPPSFPTPNNTSPEPILLAESPTNLGSYVTSFFNQAGSPYGVDPAYQVPVLSPIPGSGASVRSLTVFGGPLAIADSTVQAALNAIAAG